VTASELGRLPSGHRVFEEFVVPLRSQLHRHCYRMLGTVTDADDAVQETLLRAWRKRAELDPGRPLRAWLYRVATNVCLTALARRQARREVPGEDLEPYPDSLLGPDGMAEQREAIELVFVAAVQALPARQRAVLLLRDVCGLSAGEVADVMRTSPAAVNSALQRARSTVRHEPARLARDHAPATTAAERTLAGRLAEAWQVGDLAAIARLLTTDAILSMPPAPLVVAGPQAIAEFLRTHPGVGDPDRFRAVPTAANRQPAVALYRRDDASGAHEPYSVLVLAVRGSLIDSITRFEIGGQFARFGLPATVG
jgi:RNA polymerase sigma-70 factor (ECF subfamily)